MKLSENFKLGEFTVSGSHPQIPNNPTPEAVANIRHLVDGILQPVRNRTGMPITVTSGYRSPALNRAVGGATTSQHTKGEAADLQCANNARLFEAIRANVAFDQLIWEFGDDDAPAWVHVSLKSQGNRNEVLRAIKEKGKTKYLRL
jgi:hypothetical protein